MNKYAILFWIFIVTGCAPLTGVDPKNLESVSGSYFDFPHHLKSVRAKNPYGKVLETPANICKGRYESIYRDEDGVFYSWPEQCNEGQVGGIWVPDEYSGQGVQFWIATKASPKMKEMVDIVSFFDSLEAGNIKKYGGEILSNELLDNIEIRRK